jgi:hypothetical protein
VRWLAVLVMALALVAAGCGGGDDSAASDETTVEETTTSEDTTTSEETTTESTDTTGSGVVGSGVTEDCLSAVAAFTALGQAVGAAGGGNAANVDEAAQAFSDYADNAPDEIKADLQVLGKAYATYIKAVNDLGLQPGDTPSASQLAQLSSASQELATPEVQAAAEHWTAWAQKECPG